MNCPVHKQVAHNKEDALKCLHIAERSVNTFRAYGRTPPEEAQKMLAEMQEYVKSFEEVN